MLDLSEKHNKSEETNQKPASGFLIAHFKRYAVKWNMQDVGPEMKCQCLLSVKSDRSSKNSGISYSYF